jgi:hypothetical protein
LLTAERKNQSNPGGSPSAPANSSNKEEAEDDERRRILPRQATTAMRRLCWRRWSRTREGAEEGMWKEEKAVSMCELVFGLHLVTSNRPNP